MSKTEWKKNYVEPGTFFYHKMPCSEVCMHMRVAGGHMWAKLLENGMVQLYNEPHVIPQNSDVICLDTLKEFSAPILSGEAGLYNDENGYYYSTEQLKFGCDQCVGMMIQKAFCHETGCPDSRKVWNPEVGWIDPEPEESEDEEYFTDMQCSRCGESKHKYLLNENKNGMQICDSCWNNDDDFLE